MTCRAGLDVTLRSTHICAIDNDGELLAEGRSASKAKNKSLFSRWFIRCSGGAGSLPWRMLGQFRELTGTNQYRSVGVTSNPITT